MKPIQAIPTEYGGIKFKSRLEAQCALLFDKFLWSWEYEPRSFMLPNGLAYTPDFYISSIETWFECRGYATDKGQKQIDGFSDMISKNMVLNDDGYPITTYMVLYGDSEACTLEENMRAGMICFIHCKDCGWHPAPFSIKKHRGLYPNEISCRSCIAPMDSPGRKFWDGKAVVDAVAIVTAAEGKVLVNGVGVEHVTQSVEPE